MAPGSGVITTDADETPILSVWIAVTDATEENGCLCMIPGTVDGGYQSMGPEGLGKTAKIAGTK